MRPEKEQQVRSLVKDFKENEMVIFTDFTGIKAFDFQKIRLELHKSNVRYRVIKNRLAEIAARQCSLEPLTDFLGSPTGLALEKKEGINAAKLLVEISRENPAMKIKGGLFQGQRITADQVNDIAKCPPKEVLIGQLANLFSSPVQKLLRQLKSVPYKLVLALKAIQDKRGGQK